MVFRSARGAIALALALLPAETFAQEAVRGFTVPVSVTAGFLDSERIATDEPDEDLASNKFRTRAGLRALISPSARLGRHWLFYSAIQISTTPFFYYEAYHDERPLQVRLLQGYVARTSEGNGKAWTLIAGKLSSAFGSFPLRYADDTNPLIDQPPSYGSYLLRNNQLPCHISDFEEQQKSHPNLSEYTCIDTEDYNYGMMPVTLYGLPGAELDFTAHRLDTRLQVTNSSPANPQTLLSGSQRPQFTVGAGYTVWQGLRIGASAFHGPWLDFDLNSLLVNGKRVQNYPATGIGIDLEWARSRWSVNAEYQRFWFRYPDIPGPPAPSYGYLEVKQILSPRFYVAARVGYQDHNRVRDNLQSGAGHYLPNKQFYELAAGYRPNRFQLLKIGYEWVNTPDGNGPGDNVFGMQLVTSIDALSKTFR